MSTALRRTLSRVTCLALTLAVATSAVAARAEAPRPTAGAPAPRGGEAAPRAAPADRESAALHACAQRADLLFVRKCVQACMIDSKTRTRVLQDSFERDTCQQKCGHQRELPSFMEACMKRAGFGAPAAGRAPPFPLPSPASRGGGDPGTSPASLAAR
jgi:hypothetical protein